MIKCICMLGWVRRFLCCSGVSQSHVALDACKLAEQLDLQRIAELGVMVVSQIAMQCAAKSASQANWEPLSLADLVQPAAAQPVPEYSLALWRCVFEINE